MVNNQSIPKGQTLSLDSFMLQDKPIQSYQVRPKKSHQLKPLFSSQSGEYVTPIKLYDKLDNEFHFVLDPCTTEDNPLRCPHYYTKKDDSLKRDWDFGGAVYVNPPYGRNIIDKWVKKAVEQHQKYGITVVMLLPARTDTRWFHGVRPDYIRF